MRRELRLTRSSSARARAALSSEAFGGSVQLMILTMSEVSTHLKESW